MSQRDGRIDYRHPRKKNQSAIIPNSTLALHQATLAHHQQALTEIMVNRCDWINLPKGMDARFLEETLLFDGHAVIFKDAKADVFYGTRVLVEGPPNVYGNPRKMRSIGPGNWNIPVPMSNGVYVRNSQTGWSDIPTIELFAARLANLDLTRDINLNVQKTPYVITGPEEKQLEMLNIYASIERGEPAIIGLEALDSLVKVEVLNLNAPFLGDELNLNKRQILNEFYSYAGITNSGIAKQERMTAEEIDINTEDVIIRRLNYLRPRRAAAKALNERFGLDIQVVWSRDLDSKNFATLNDAAKMLDLEEDSDV